MGGSNSRIFAAPMHFHQTTQTRLFLSRELIGWLEVQAAQESTIFFAEAKQLNFACLLAELFEFP